MVKTLEPLVKELPKIDLDGEGFLAYQREQQKMKYSENFSSECFSFDGCYSPSSCIDCYSV